MSLIFDALKKAEKETQKTTSINRGLSNPIIQDKKEGAQKRVFILLALLIISAGFLVYNRFLKRPPGPAPSPAPATAQPKVDGKEDPASLKSKAIDLVHGNKLEEAQAILQKLTLLLPTDAEVYNNLGFVSKKLGKKENAYQAYHQALALKKDYPEALNNLGVLLLEDGVKAEAKSQFQKSIELSQKYPDPHFNLALVLEQEGNTKEAANQYKIFLQLSPAIDEDLKKKVETKITHLETVP